MLVYDGILNFTTFDPAMRAALAVIYRRTMVLYKMNSFGATHAFTS